MNRTIRFLFGLGLLACTPSAFACVQCEVWWGDPVCGPGHSVGGYSCFMQFHPELQVDTCVTMGDCSSYDPPWNPPWDPPWDPPWGPPWDYPFSDSAGNKKGSPSLTSQGTSRNSNCLESEKDPESLRVNFSNTTYDAPKEVQHVISALQPTSGVILAPSYFEGVTSTPNLSGQQQLGISNHGRSLVRFEGGFVFDDSGEVFATISFSGATSVSEALVVLTPLRAPQETQNRPPESNDQKLDVEYWGSVSIIE